MYVNRGGIYIPDNVGLLRARKVTLHDLIGRNGVEPIDAHHYRDLVDGSVHFMPSGAGGAQRIYRAHNGASVTTAAFVSITTGTNIKTLMQLATPATQEAFIIEWGISFDGSAAATPGKCELIQTDVGATVTAYAAADLVGLTDPGQLASQMVVTSTTNSGFTSSGEGSITATKMFDNQLVAPTNQYVKQFPLGQEPRLPISKWVRVRVHFGTAINATCYIVWAE